MRYFMLMMMLLAVPSYAEDMTEDTTTTTTEQTAQTVDPIVDIMKLNDISPAAGLGNSIAPNRPRNVSDARDLYFDLQAVSGEGQF